MHERAADLRAHTSRRPLLLGRDGSRASGCRDPMPGGAGGQPRPYQMATSRDADSGRRSYSGGCFSPLSAARGADTNAQGVPPSPGREVLPPFFGWLRSPFATTRRRVLAWSRCTVGPFGTRGGPCGARSLQRAVRRTGGLNVTESSAGALAEADGHMAVTRPGRDASRRAGRPRARRMASSRGRATQRPGRRRHAGTPGRGGVGTPPRRAAAASARSDEGGAAGPAARQAIRQRCWCGNPRMCLVLSVRCVG
ncbi:MAG: hypothetical protein QOJ23_4820 [Actinomycetota bacterium]|nr:hypothetical protein [Actinomycetota bacterium]